MNTVRFTMEFTEPVREKALRHAVEAGMKRYPYFAVKIVRCAENWVLEENNRSFVISPENKTVCLGSEEANGHLVAFAYEENAVSIDMSHYIADGTGMTPLFKTIAWYYLKEVHPEAELDASDIRLSGSDIPPEEENHPFPAELLPETGEAATFEADALLIPDDRFDDLGVYAYHLQVAQAKFVRFARANGGSPVSMLTALLSELIRAQFPEAGKDIVCGIPHQLRGVLGKPLAHDNLIAMPFVKITPEMKGLTLAELNRNIREQLRKNAGEEADIRTVNGMMQLDAYLDQMPLAVKQQTIQEIVAESRRPFTFSVSYTGQVSWGGMERYIRDVHFYVDENVISEKVECEVYTIWDCFSLTVMQHGKNDFLVSALEKELNARGVPCHRTGEKRYRLCAFQLDYE